MFIRMKNTRIHNFGRFLKNMLQLVLAPIRGWEDIAMDDVDDELPVAPSFYALCAIVSLSWLLQKVYHPEMGWDRVIELIIVTFAVFFLSFFVGNFIISVALESLARHGDVTDRRTRLFVMFGVALLAFVMLLANLLPAPTPVLWFIPVYIVVVLWKGAAFVNVPPQKAGIFTLISFIAVLLPAMLLGWLFKILLLS